MLYIFIKNTVFEASRLNQGSREYAHRHYEGVLSAISMGFFLILVGSMFVATPNLAHDVGTFLNHFKVVAVENTNISVPAPQYNANISVYQALQNVFLAAREFSLVWGVFLIAMLGARFLLGSPLRRKAENVGDIVFWLGATYLVQTLLVIPTQTSPIISDSNLAATWFKFWAAVIMFIGVSLIARAVFLAAARARNI